MRKSYLLFHSSGDLQSIFPSCLEHYCEKKKRKKTRGAMFHVNKIHIATKKKKGFFPLKIE